MKYISLTKEKRAIVDNGDFARINELNWCFSNGYAAKKTRGNKNLFMHTLIMSGLEGMKIDHKMPKLCPLLTKETYFNNF